MEGGGKGEIIYLSLHCHHQNDFCINVGSDESHFNVSSIVGDKDTRQCPQTTTFEEKGEQKRIRTEVTLSAYQPNALPLGQTGHTVVTLIPCICMERTGRLTVGPVNRSISLNHISMLLKDISSVTS